MLPQDRFKSGAAAELYVAARLTQAGYTVLWPFVTQSRYDLVAEKGGVFQKIQVKKATSSRTGSFDYLQARLSGKNKQTNTPYKREDVDVFAFTDMDRIWIAPYEEIGHQTSVCLDSTNPKYKPQTRYDASAWLLADIPTVSG